MGTQDLLVREVPEPAGIRAYLGRAFQATPVLVFQDIAVLARAEPRASQGSLDPSYLPAIAEPLDTRDRVPAEPRAIRARVTVEPLAIVV